MRKLKKTLKIISDLDQKQQKQGLKRTLIPRKK